jgi:serine protease AprX
MRLAFLLLFFLYIQCAKAQYSRHIIELTDKKGGLYTLNKPDAFLSPESVERKKFYKITIDSTDLPVSHAYLDSIRKAGRVEILGTSRWLNMVLIKTTDAATLNKISQFPFVKKRTAIANRPSGSVSSKTPDVIFETTVKNDTKAGMKTALDYGRSNQQISIHEGEFLHNEGWTGSGIKIAVLDAGFNRYQNIGAFDSLRLRDGIKMTKDLVENTNSVNEDDAHGMYCLSIMAANLPGIMVGTAPHASYYLFRTEDVNSEFPVEEFYWVSAAEMADSIGVSIISSSLGYYTFDDPIYNYSYAAMNGNTTIVSRGASMASNKGILVMNSAGNEGNKPWKYVIAPADAENVLAVGAVNTLRQVASFSSHGPSFDNRVKPDIASVGWNTFLISTTGNVAQGSGTSFSNPNIAGLIACLWQAFPEFNNKEIIDVVRKSSHRYTNPDTRTGYGIPNMRIAFDLLEKERSVKKVKAILKNERIKVYPNPFNDKITMIYFQEKAGDLKLSILSMDGKIIQKKTFTSQGGEYHFFTLDNLISLPKGQYLLKYEDDSGKGVFRVQK